LLTLDQSAYHTKVDLDADAIYLIAMDAAFRLAPGEAPYGMKLDLGDNAVATPSAFIFWSNGAIWIAPKHGGSPGRLAELRRRPQYFVASGETFAWIERNEDGHDAIRGLRGNKPYTIHKPSGTVDAATMLDDRVIFVERVEPTGWHIGAVHMHGGRPSFTATRTGRSPAMLVAARDVYYYDGNVFEVRALSSDLRDERVLATDIVCSPLAAAADRIVCGQVEGLFELSLADLSVRLVSPNMRSVITALAVDRERVVWVTDVGRDKLEVKLQLRGDP